MNTTTVQRYFPDSQAVLVHQTGAELTMPSRGVTVILHTSENESDPCSAEIISGEHYADIGLSFNGKELVDYDGVFSLPREVAEMLTGIGYVVPKETTATMHQCPASVSRGAVCVSPSSPCPKPSKSTLSWALLSSRCKTATAASNHMNIPPST
jgi:hypothetical protein